MPGRRNTSGMGNSKVDVGTMKERCRTAEEVVAELEEDPEWVWRREAAQRRSEESGREFYREERPVLEALEAVGVRIPSIADSKQIEYLFPLSETVVGVFLAWLPKVHWRIQEAIVSLLAAAAEPFDGQALAQLFDTRYLRTLMSLLPNTRTGSTICDGPSATPSHAHDRAAFRNGSVELF